MTSANPATLFTPDDLLRMEDSVSYELVEGRLVQRHSGMLSSAIAAQIGVSLGSSVYAQALGHLFGADAGYHCFPNPGTVRKADVSFIRSGRFPNDRVPQGHSPIPPDLAVEVISPNDLAYEVEEKVAEYLEAGVPLVWIVNPPTRSVRVRRPKSAANGPVSELLGDDEISGEGVLPGFSCKVSEFFF